MNCFVTKSEPRRLKINFHYKEYGEFVRELMFIHYLRAVKKEMVYILAIEEQM